MGTPTFKQQAVVALFCFGGWAVVCWGFWGLSPAVAKIIIGILCLITAYGFAKDWGIVEAKSKPGRKADGRQDGRIDPLLTYWLRPEQVRQLATINKLSGESWQKTLQDAVDIALGKYQDIANTEAARRKQKAPQ